MDALHDYIPLFREIFPLKVACPIEQPNWVPRKAEDNYFVQTPGYEFGITCSENKVRAYHRPLYSPHAITETLLTDIGDFVGWLSYTQERLVDLCYEDLRVLFEPTNFFPGPLDKAVGSLVTLRAMGQTHHEIATKVAILEKFNWTKEGQRYSCSLTSHGKLPHPDDAEALQEGLAPRVFLDPVTRKLYEGGRIYYTFHTETQATAHCAIRFPGDANLGIKGRLMYNEFPWRVSNRSLQHFNEGPKENLRPAIETIFVKLGLEVIDPCFQNTVFDTSTAVEVFKGLLKK